jgi:WD40 repeat protein
MQSSLVDDDEVLSEFSEPDDIILDDHIFDAQFSPSANVIATGQITGVVKLYNYDHAEPEEKLSFDFHTDSVRKVMFSADGDGRDN